MKIQSNQWKFVSVVLGALLVVSVSMNFAGDVFAEPQPHMVKALELLRAAKAELTTATHDKGGFRVAAIGNVDKAIRQVEKGITVDNRTKTVKEGVKRKARKGKAFPKK